MTETPTWHKWTGNYSMIAEGFFKRDGGNMFQNLLYAAIQFLNQFGIAKGLV